MAEFRLSPEAETELDVFGSYCPRELRYEKGRHLVQALTLH